MDYTEINTLKEIEQSMSNRITSVLDEKLDGLDDVVRVDGQIIARLPAGTLRTSEIIDSLTGILKGDYDLDEVKTEALREKYGLVG